MQSSNQHHIRGTIRQTLGVLAILAMVVTGGGCKKYLTIPLPINSVAGAEAFSTDQTTAGVLNYIYTTLAGSGELGGGTKTFGGLGLNAGLYTDELQVTTIGSATVKSFYANKIIGDDGGLTWAQLYQLMNVANTTLEAMNSSTLPFRNQWKGEAYFLRALMYYYLVNLYGDVPLSLTSDYKVNNNLSRAPQSEVYKQMVADLLQAQTLLSADYLDNNGGVVTDRARPNKAAAAALLARVYLGQGDWVNAETQASAVISNSAYQLETPDKVFLVAGKENIWGLLPTASSNNVTADAATYIITNGATPVTSQVAAVMSPQLLSSFEPNDARFINWVGVSTVVTGTDTAKYYYPWKYKMKGTQSSITETFSILRLAEQYLIRAEARAKQNKLNEAIGDVDVIRGRAGLTGTTATTQQEVLAAVLQERRVEFFTEQGFRFFDLKRMGSIDNVMTIVSPQKNSNWAPYMQYWPIPTSETLANLNLKQTPGYQQ